MSAQAHLVATMDPRFEADFDRGVEQSNQGAARVAALHDPVVTRISATANAADHTHDATVGDKLFPAVEAGDRDAALAALETADRAVGVVLEKVESIGEHVNARHAAAIGSAHAATATARRLGIVAGLLAVLLAAGAAFFVVRGIRRGVAVILDRLSTLTQDADSLAGALDAAATGDLTASVASHTAAIEQLSSDEIGQVAGAVNTIRERTEASIASYDRMVSGLRDLVADVSAAAGTVSASSQQMASTADEAGRAVGEIAAPIGEVAHSADRQARTVESSRRLSDELNEASRTSAESAEVTGQAVARARELAGQGAAAAQGATEAMAAVRSASADATKTIRDLGATLGGDQRHRRARSPASPSRPTCSRSTPRSRPPAPASRAAASPSWPRRSASWPRSPSRAAATIAGLIGEIQRETAARRRGRRERRAPHRRGREHRPAGRCDVPGARRVRRGHDRPADGRDRRADRRHRRVLHAHARADGRGRRAWPSAPRRRPSRSRRRRSRPRASAQEIAASAQELAITATTLEQLVGRFTLAR